MSFFGRFDPTIFTWVPPWNPENSLTRKGFIGIYSSNIRLESCRVFTAVGFENRKICRKKRKQFNEQNASGKIIKTKTKDTSGRYNLFEITFVLGEIDI